MEYRRRGMTAAECIIELSEVCPVTGCWLWTRGLDADGYGRIGFGSRNSMLAHRLSYATFCGSLDPELTIDHLCEVRKCVNPDHLDQVTQLVNNVRSALLNAQWERQRAAIHCKRGHPFDDSNTYLHPRGHRECRTCRRLGKIKSKRDAGGTSWQK